MFKCLTKLLCICWCFYLGQKHLFKVKHHINTEECYNYCHKPSHWCRNCKKFLEDHKKKKESETFADINDIEINLQLILVSHGYLKLGR